MEDKEIINGVDVAECGYFCEADNECSICGMGTDGEDTHLKTSYQENQEYFLELKAENERLRFPQKDLSYAVLSKEEFEGYQNLKQENERLQKLTCFNCGEETLSPSGAEIYDKILVYKQTLQEIKEIAEFHITQADSEDVQEDMKQILDLITKAEEE